MAVVLCTLKIPQKYDGTIRPLYPWRIAERIGVELPTTVIKVGWSLWRTCWN
ncbi:MAG: hypothetical protein IIW42_06305 [Bacteroidaceae bacterium]|nr:hypothetical protein [Bacteroidaceae bacterium]